ncbi:MAG: TetR family transcriptional regulator [Spirochaetia bacterium]
MDMEQIVDAAFTAWGDTHFTETGLSRVSHQLGVTKQALYRRISGKAQLLQEMERQFAKDLDAVIDEFEAAARESSLSQVVELYVDLVFGFFREHPYYYLYLTLHLAQFRGNQGAPFREVTVRHRSVLGEILSRFGFAGSRENRMAVHFLSMSGFLWMAGCFWTVDGHRREAREYPLQIETRRTLAARIISRGLFPHAPADIDFAGVEAVSTVEEHELPERNRILNAIAEVVTEEGFEQATVEKIAESAGMSKSSLYYHFRNRTQMVASMLVPERDRLLALVENRVSAYSDFSYRLYAFMVVTASYASHSRSILTALDWMRFHRIRIYLEDEPDYSPVYGFLAEPLEQEGYLHAGLSEMEVAAYLHHLVMRPVLEEDLGAGERPAQMLRNIRLLYRMVVGGLIKEGG